SRRLRVGANSSTCSRAGRRAAVNKPVRAPRPTPAVSHHVFPVRVYYEDTDAAGIVYYANYLKFAERARTEMLRAHGFEHGGIGAGLAFAVRSCAVDYLRPARLDDALEVRTRITRVGGASLEADQDICRA